MAWLGETMREPIAQVVDDDLCIGCGACAAVCPRHAIRLALNHDGEYRPLVSRYLCIRNCSLCGKVCPFGKGVHDESALATALYGVQSGIQWNEATGYLLASHVGFVTDSRLRRASSSGGLARWFLGSVLRRRHVDHVIAVVPGSEPGTLFKFAVIDNAEEVGRVAKSCYYPVEMSDVLAEVGRREGTYAIIGLPCFIKAIRLAARTNVRLRTRIQVVAGLVCGRTKNTFFGEYCCSLEGGLPSAMRALEFRVKDPARPANDYGVSFDCSHGPVRRGKVSFSQVSPAWNRNYFTPNACAYCDDLFAEVGDVAFMDAWLDRFITDDRGTSVALVRSARARAIFEEGSANGEIDVRPLSLEEVLQAQAGALAFKRRGLAERLGAYRMLSWRRAPVKRVRPARVGLYRLVQLAAERFLAQGSTRAFAATRNRAGVAAFERAIMLRVALLKCINYLEVLTTRLLRRGRRAI